LANSVENYMVLRSRSNVWSNAANVWEAHGRILQGNRDSTSPQPQRTRPGASLRLAYIGAVEQTFGRRWQD